MRVKRRADMNYTDEEIESMYQDVLDARARHDSMIVAVGVTEPPEGCTVRLMGSFANDDPETHASLAGGVTGE